MAEDKVQTETKGGKPLLWADEDFDPLERFNPRNFRGSDDPSRIEGYSEAVRANDIEKADDLVFREQNQGRTKEDVYRSIGSHPQALPVEFQWLRVCGPAGSDSPTAARELDRKLTQEGFRLATEDDLERYGYSLSPNAWKAADGTIRRGPDVALYVRSGEVARMWERFTAEEAAKAEGAPLPDAMSAGEHAAPTFSEEERDTAYIAH